MLLEMINAFTVGTCDAQVDERERLRKASSVARSDQVQRSTCPWEGEGVVRVANDAVLRTGTRIGTRTGTRAGIRIGLRLSWFRRGKPFPTAFRV